MNLLVLSAIVGVAFALDDLRLYRQNIRLRRINAELRREVGVRRRHELYSLMRARLAETLSAARETGL